MSKVQKFLTLAVLIIGSFGLIPGDALGTNAGGSQAAIEDVGDFRLTFVSPNNSDYIGIYRFLKNAGRFQQLVDELNQNLALPADIAIRFEEGEGPYYNPETLAVIINYEFVEYVTELFLQAGYVDADSEEELFSAVLDVTEFILYHEIGHALVHTLGLPITGKEEDAVDALATVILTEFVDGGAEILLTAADVFALAAESETEFEEADFWDEHSLDIQRFYSIICWVYGSNPEQYAQLVTEEGIDEARAVNCPQEYAQKVYSWLTLLSPYFKE